MRYAIVTTSDCRAGVAILRDNQSIDQACDAHEAFTGQCLYPVSTEDGDDLIYPDIREAGAVADALNELWWGPGLGR